MSKHLFGLVVTSHGMAANNRGENEGNITTLQKVLWNGEVHTTVSAEAIRFAMRWYWQRLHGAEKMNRQWDDAAASHIWADPDFKEWETHLDDNLLGFMSAKAAKEEGNDSEKPAAARKKSRGTCDKRRARLEITRAISLSPFAGDITFNAASPGATPSASSTGKDPVPYGTEMHATRYQYAFALTPEALSTKARALDAVDAIISLPKVAGNHARFLFDFSPDSVIFRWTDDFAPRMLYGFIQDGEGNLDTPTILQRVKAGDIAAEELILGGSIASLAAGRTLRQQGACVKEGVKAAADELKSRMRADLRLT